MQPIYGWETIEEAGTYKKIELGGHICIIEGVKIEPTKKGGQMMVIVYDFAPNDTLKSSMKLTRSVIRKQNGEAYSIRILAQSNQIRTSSA